jgi:ketosteroid isomerase-like protein
MYHSVVRSKLRKTFDSLNVEDYAPVLGSLAPAFEHVFCGDHALGGARDSLDAVQRWYARLPRVLPKLKFTVDRIVVSGWPWNTVAYVEWRDAGRTLDGLPFNNQGVHVVVLRWGKVVSVRIFCDTKLLSEVLKRNAEHGVAEAAAPPIDERTRPVREVEAAA